MSTAGEKIIKRHKAALNKRQMWDGLLRDAFAMAAPNVDSGFTSATQGSERTQEVVDGTALQATRDAARSEYTSITPPQSQFFSLGLSRPAKRQLQARGLDQNIEARKILTVNKGFAPGTADMPKEMQHVPSREATAGGAGRTNEPDTLASPTRRRVRANANNA